MRRLAFLAAHLALSAAADTAVPTASARTTEEWQKRCAAELSSAKTELTERDPRFAAVAVKQLRLRGATDGPLVWAVVGRKAIMPDGFSLRAGVSTACKECDDVDVWDRRVRRLSARDLSFFAKRGTRVIIGAISGESPSMEFVRDVVLARLERALDHCYEIRPRRK